MDQPTVLIIAPEGTDRDSFAADLRQAGCRVETAESGLTGEQTAAVANPDVIVLPATLPDADSLLLCQRIRSLSGNNQSPIFLVTPDDEASGNGAGTRRFDRLAVGVNAILHANRPRGNGIDLIRCGSLVIDVDRHRASLGSGELKLTPTEFRLLATLAEDPERVYTRKQLADACRGDGASPQGRTIDVHIKAIRQKLGDHGDSIETVHGVGYRMKRADAAASGK